MKIEREPVKAEGPAFLKPGVEVRVTLDGRTWVTLEGVRVRRYFTKGGEVFHLTPINPAEIPT